MGWWKMLRKMGKKLYEVVGCVDNLKDCHILNFTQACIQYYCNNIVKPEND
jgi:hypothetical protein